ncbi:MAG: TrkA family potassium uptake protein [bacterium]
MKQIAVIGLGNFGYHLATNLCAKGHEVMAIDRDPQKVQAIKDLVTRAVMADATDREVLEDLGLRQMDTVVVSIGTEMSNSILATLHLKEIGVKRVVAMAISEPHERILRRVGASEVVFPEKDLATSLAEKLHNPNMLDYLPFSPDYSIVELAPPRKFIGRSLKELDLINRYGVQVVAVRELVPERLNMIPTGNFVVKDSDIIILLGPNKSLEKIREQDV